MKSSRMLPKTYHAIAFLSVLLMLLLLGLHLLGFSFLSGGGSPLNAPAALSQNATTGASSSPAGASSTLNPNAVYRHPIVYDKLTGATNKQIQDVLGSSSKQQDELPLDHYQRQPSTLDRSLQFDGAPFGGGPDPFAVQLGQPGGGNGRGFFRHPLAPHLPPPPSLHHPVGAELSRHHAHLTALPPPPPPMPLPPAHLMGPSGGGSTTQSPQLQPAHPTPPPTEARSQPQQQHLDSLPSASSLNNNTSQSLASPPQAQPPPQLAQYYQQQQQPIYYTPPIFTYSNNFDAPQQRGQPPPLGVPEAPLSVDEFNARQNRLRQLGGSGAQTSDNNEDKSPVNLLADPLAQQRHKQQMLDRHLLFGPPAPISPNPSAGLHRPVQFLPAGSSQPPLQQPDNFTNAHYPDPNLYAARLQQLQAPPPGDAIRPPYAQPVATQLEPPSQLAPVASKQPPQASRIPLQRPHVSGPPVPEPRPPQALVRSGQQAPSSQQQQVAASSGSRLAQTPAPQCARQLEAAAGNLSLALPVQICNEDSEYPTSEIMRALEQFATERSIEQLIPQQLVQMLSQTRASPAELQRQLVLDPLQSVSSPSQTSATDPTNQQVFEPACQSSVWIAQPRRAKTLTGQWKIVVNLPGHKYRGIAISQMVRLEECQRPQAECSPASNLAPVVVSSVVPQRGQQQAHRLQQPRSRCLQNYGNQRLLAWSHQQGLHFDLFRVPVACSCHIRRST